MSDKDQTYHTATFWLLGFEPHPSMAAKVIVKEAESRLGISFPQSVRQWYECDEAIQILAEYSNQDPPIPVKDFTVIESQSRHLLPFRDENQGVCTWAIHLDGSDDPPVYVDVDSGGKEWQLLASTFSSYIFSCVWDYRMVFHQHALVQAQHRVLSASTLAVLKASFRQEVQTHGWPGNTQYRFSGDRGAILIWSSEKQADWFVGSDQSEGLEMTLQKIWNLEELGTSLYDISPIGKIVLDKLRL